MKIFATSGGVDACSVVTQFSSFVGRHYWY